MTGENTERRATPANRPAKGVAENCSGFKAGASPSGSPAMAKAQLKNDQLLPDDLLSLEEPGDEPEKPAQLISFHHFIQPLTKFSDVHFVLFMLDEKSQVVGYRQLAKGAHDVGLVNAREVFRAALLSGAHAVIVAHNSSGLSVSASRHDIELTRKLIEAGETLGIELVDHCIVAGESMNCMRETECYLWGE